MSPSRLAQGRTPMVKKAAKDAKCKGRSESLPTMVYLAITERNLFRKVSFDPR
jgi:hypothetical protein